MRAYRSLFLTFVLCSAPLAGAAAAENVSEAMQLCSDSDLTADRRISACTAVLDSKRALNNASVHARRARAYVELKDYQNALADLEAAAKLDKRYADAISAQLLIRAGHVSEAAAKLRDTGDFDDLLSVRIDREFASAWEDPALRELLRPENIVSRDLSLARSRYERQPEDADARVNLVRALMVNDRYDEVVDLIRSLPEATLRHPKDAQEAWLTAALADALMARGDTAGANQIMARLTQLPLQWNSHLAGFVMHYGEMLFEQGRYADALDVVEKPGPTSEAGEAIRRKVRVCASDALGRTTAAESELARFEDSPDQVFLKLEALICLNRLDEAGALLVKIMRSADRRFSSLLFLQECRVNPLWTENKKTLHARLLSVRDRPEVRRAIDEVGVILELPINC